MDRRLAAARLGDLDRTKLLELGLAPDAADAVLARSIDEVAGPLDPALTTRLRAAVGEPVTWTLELTGTGNWPDLGGLPARTVSQDFQVVQPKAKRVNAEGKLFDATLTEDVVLGDELYARIIGSLKRSIERRIGIVPAANTTHINA